MAENGRLKRADEQLALALASGRRVVDAAESAGLSERTAYRRRAEPDFQARVKELRSELVDAASGRLVATMTKAVVTLKRLLDDEDSNVQARAAGLLLTHALRVTELVDLAERVAALEARPGGAKP